MAAPTRQTAGYTQPVTPGPTSTSTPQPPAERPSSANLATATGEPSKVCGFLPSELYDYALLPGNRTRENNTVRKLLAQELEISVLTMVLVLILRIQVFRAVLLAVTVLPLMAFTGNEGKCTTDGQDTKNELFHVGRFLTSSGEESKASLRRNATAPTVTGLYA